MTDYRRKCLDKRINCCWACGDTDNLEVHHVDGDRDNNEFDNLLPLCKACHGKVHNELVGKSRERIEALKDYLPKSKICTIGPRNLSVTLTEEQWMYVYTTMRKQQSFDDRVRELVDKGMAVEQND